jgi:hypothetical protein
MKKFPCLGCEYPTDTDSGFCSKYCSKYSAKFHLHNYRMRQKCKAETEALQPAKTSELLDETLQPIKTFELSDETYKLTIETLQPTVGYKLSIEGRTRMPAKIYKLSDGKELDDEDLGIDLFGD